MLKYLLIPLLMLSLSQCTLNPTRQIDERCNLLNRQSAVFLTEFHFDNDSTYLDSALYVINQALEICDCEELRILLSFRKLAVLSLTRDYEQALQFIKLLENEELDLVLFPFSGNVLYRRFQAMQAQYLGNMTERNEHLRFIVNRIADYLMENRQEVDAIFTVSDATGVLKGIGMAIIQYYYYRSVLEGVDVVTAELVLMQEKEGINKDVVEGIIVFLEADFMIFWGW